MPKTANKDLKNHTYCILKERLVNCIYPPGTLLNEAQLAADLGASRTPVREAISRLEMEGFVKIMPKKGIYVTDISLNDVLQIFQTRIEIEPIAVRLAAPHLPREELLAFCGKFKGEAPDIQNGFRLDTAMHLFIIEHCGNRYIIDMMHRIFDENTRVIISSKQNQVQIHDARLEHLDILNSLLDKDTERAIALMQSHIENCRKAALDYFCSIQTYKDSPSLTYKNQLAQL
ncbi:GntR family transcriptional regulator [Enterocloster aldenensis]|uniref:GntR family transcriptional regulator n=1 Tax=Enterocloster aldenensis TaxID=358742 RepID=UPI000E423A45|nr:GntR family transcriptional regulator [Enterocloster aldenensis]